MIKPIFQNLNIKPILSSRISSNNMPNDNSRNVVFKNKRVNNSLIQNVLESIADKNIIGEGKNSKVYKFLDDSLSKYVIKVLKPNCNSTPSLNELPRYNFGQAICKIQDNIYVLRKQYGVQHGFTKWRDIVNGKNLEKEEAKSFLEDLKKISNMPDKTFDSYAEKTKYISENGYKSDSINPNNILIDYDKNEINIIDYFKTNKKYVNSKNCYLDMACNLLDFMNFKKIYDVLSKSEQKEFIESANIITKKCYEAAKRTGLSTNKEEYNDFLSRVSILLKEESLIANFTSFCQLVRLR